MTRKSSSKKSAFFFAIAASAAMAEAPVAYGDDLKVFPGAQCESEYSTSYGDGTAPQFDHWGGAYTNRHPSYEHVVCPIERDNITNTTGTKAVLARIYNPGGGRGFWCQLFSSNKYGGAGTIPGYPSFPSPLESFQADAPSTGLYELSLDVSKSTAGGYYVLHCEVPPNGVIYSYESREF